MEQEKSRKSSVHAVVAARALMVLAFLLISIAPAQDLLQNVVTTGWGDMAEIKRSAEAGDARAQYKLANSLATRLRSKEALQWYSKAAQQGDVESLYQMGHMLYSGAPGLPSEQAVPADPAEGIRILFVAATNGNNAAFHDMYRAYREGRGVAKDLAQAYAWLQLHVDTSKGLFMPASRPELNQFALDVDVATSQEGKRLAALYRSGKWPTLVVQPNPQPKSPPITSPAPTTKTVRMPTPPPRTPVPLTLNAIALGQRPTAAINGKLLSVGESATIIAKPQNIVLKCLKIDSNSVVVSVDGEAEPRFLRMK